MYRISRNTCVFLKFCIIWLPSPPRTSAAPRAPCELRQPTRTNGTHLEGCPNPGDQWLLPWASDLHCFPIISFSDIRSRPLQFFYAFWDDVTGEGKFARAGAVVPRNATLDAAMA